MIPFTCGYARVSKLDNATRSPETQLHVLQEFGIREEHIITGGMTGSSLSRPGWNELMTQYSPTTPSSPFSATSSYQEPGASTAAEETDGKRPARVNTVNHGLEVCQELRVRIEPLLH